MSVTLRSMRYYITALAHGNISRAASELNVAASAVGAAIDQIEAQFGLKLVNRHRSRGIVATASGRAIERKFAYLLEEYETVLAEALDLKQSMRGELRLGYYAPVAPAFFPDLLSEVLAQESGTTLYLTECDNDQAQAGLLAGDFDAILFVSNVVRPQVGYDVLIQAPAYCLVAADHALANKTAIRMSDLSKEPIIVLNRQIAVDYYQELFRQAGHSPRIIAYANSTEMVRSLVGAGYGCAVLNMLPATSVSYAGDSLVAVPIDADMPALSLAVGYDKTGPRRVVTHFVERCTAHFQSPKGRRLIVAAQKS